MSRRASTYYMHPGDFQDDLRTIRWWSTPTTATTTVPLRERDGQAPGSPEGGRFWSSRCTAQRNIRHMFRCRPRVCCRRRWKNWSAVCGAAAPRTRTPSRNVLKRAEKEIASRINYPEHVVNDEVDTCADAASGHHASVGAAGGILKELTNAQAAVADAMRPSTLISLYTYLHHATAVKR